MRAHGRRDWQESSHASGQEGRPPPLIARVLAAVVAADGPVTSTGLGGVLHAPIYHISGKLSELRALGLIRTHGRRPPSRGRGVGAQPYVATAAAVALVASWETGRGDGEGHDG